ncbi:MAG: AMP-binding protein [Aquamicrobium sp.]|uniref:AMP-binding protein n=1 Tax=Aquamicrobium sp. TaxID=1872579 RepID=UPI00349EDE4A|nr:AMP-binding protein [Aquamicrobium sp.]MCO5158582.1 AMP-binding protein [Aquamicrobium sp.]
MRIPGGHAAWTTIPALLRERAATHGDSMHVEIAGRRLTIGEVDRLSDRMAAAFHAAGVRKGDRVCCFMSSSMEGFLTWMGAAKLGAIWAPLNSGLIGDDLSYTLNDADAAVLVVDDACREKVVALGDAVRIPQLPLHTGEGVVDGFLPFASLFHAVSEGPPPVVPLEASDPAVILYTGGTTGMPKGVLLPHFAWIGSGYRVVDGFGLTGQDRYYSVLPMFHVGGLMCGLIGPLVAGCSTTLDPAFSVTRFWSRVRETRATVIDPIGTMIALLVRLPPGKDDRNHCVRASLGVFSQTAPEIWQEFSRRHGIPFLNCYSSSEVGGAVLVHNRMNPDKQGSNGRTWGWADIRIVDAEGKDVPAGVIGQILLRSNVPHAFMLGYYNKPERTAESMRDGWYHSGDLGFLDDEGDLTFTGRQAHWLRRRGENISAYEVERIVARFPGVVEAVVVGVPSELGEEDVKAFLIVEPGAAVDFAALVRWCEERMAHFKVPRFLEIVGDFPRSTTKREVERHKLRDRPNHAAWDRERELGRAWRRKA